MATQENDSKQHMLPEGLLIHGNLVIEKRLSNGNFGNTYAVHDMLGRRFALKEFFMSGYTARDADGLRVNVSNPQNLDLYNSQLEKFKKEAMRLSQLSHPGIVKVHDLFIENDTAYYLMDLVDGESLQAVTAKRGALPEAEAMGYFRQALEALGYVHSQGLFHLDIKPGNMMLESATGKVKLIDFGASKQMSAQGGATAGTAAAFTHGYAPAELVNGNLDKVGAWTDLYSLGGALYSLVTATLPPDASDVLNEGEGAFRYPLGVSAPTRRLISWLMQPSYKQRPQSAAEVLAAINAPGAAPSAPEPAMAQQPYQPYNPPYQPEPAMPQQPYQPEAPLPDYGSGMPPAYIMQPKKSNAGKIVAIVAAALVAVGVVAAVVWYLIPKKATYLTPVERYVDIEEDGGTTRFYVNTDSEGVVTSDVTTDSPWLSAVVDGRELIIEAEANDGDERTAEILLRADDITATVTVAQAASTTIRGVVNKIWVDHNHVRRGVEGMLIHVDFSVRNLRGLTGRAIAWFYKEDGSYLTDSDGNYCTTDGQVSVGEDFTPSYDDSHYSDFTLFIPNSELHLPAGGGDGYFVVGLVYGHDHISPNSDRQTFNWN